ncbi:MAG: type VI secretion system baseplate subunit TssG [Pseudomonadota bacterium]
MSWKQRLAEEPWRFNLFWVLNREEALNEDKPRIGDTATRRDEFIDLGQVPFLDFPASNTASYDPKTNRQKSRLRTKFLGMLGPMGPLPSNLTEEALSWFSRRDDAFVRFLDIFNNRFLQLFYRAHSDCRPASQALRPNQDRFRDYVGSALGIGTETWRALDSMPDGQKYAYAGILGPRTVSASRIENVLSGIFGIECEVDQFIGTFLPLAQDEQTRLGAAHTRLGQEAIVGERVLTVDNKFCVRLFPGTLENYERFLPDGDANERLVDALSNIVGFEYEWDVELVLPHYEPRPSELGAYGQLGWTTWMRKPSQEKTQTYVKTRFSPSRGDAVTI